MLRHSSVLFLATLLAALPVDAEGLYSKKSPVLQVNQNNYDSLIANSNHTSIVEFYAPWCGHCKNLKPAYEKAATSLDGLAKVAAVNCDDDDNKAFCGRMGVQGFPTLKIMTPSKKPGKPRVEDYQGPRTAKAIVDAVVDRIPNHVKRATDKDLDEWLAQNEERPKAVLFSEKGSTSALIRALAIDFLGAIDFAQVRSKESASVEKFGVTEFPTLVLVPGGDEGNKVYEGELKKQPITEFLSQVVAPNPDAAPASVDSKPKPKSKAKASTKPTSVAEDVDIDADNLKPTESPDPRVNDSPESKPAQVPIAAPPIPTLATPESLESACLAPKSGTCVLALLPEPSGSDSALQTSATDALASLAEIAHKHAQRGAHLFPLYAVPAMNAGSQTLRDGLGLADVQDVELVAVNARRGWWRHYNKDEGFGAVAVETWIDAVRLGDGAKEKLPDGIVVEGQAKAETEAEADAKATAEAEHDEL